GGRQTVVHDEPVRGSIWRAGPADSWSVKNPGPGMEAIVIAGRRVQWTATAACLALAVIWQPAMMGQTTGDARPQGWAVRASLNNPSARLYNNAKQKLLDWKQIFTYTISRLNVELYCEVAKHYDYVWFEMQHSTMSFRDIEEMIAACPRPVATPVI